MANAVAYALKAEYERDFAGASMAARDGSTINLGARLENGGGVIVVDPEKDADLASGLDANEAFKQVPVPKPRERQTKGDNGGEG